MMNVFNVLEMIVVIAVTVIKLFISVIFYIEGNDSNAKK